MIRKGAAHVFRNTICSACKHLLNDHVYEDALELCPCHCGCRCYTPPDDAPDVPHWTKKGKR